MFVRVHEQRLLVCRFADREIVDARNDFLLRSLHLHDLEREVFGTDSGECELLSIPFVPSPRSGRGVIPLTSCCSRSRLGLKAIILCRVGRPCLRHPIAGSSGHLSINRVRPLPNEHRNNMPDHTCTTPTMPKRTRPMSLVPRGLSRVEAATYVGVSASMFDEMVKDGRMPGPKRIALPVLPSLQEIIDASDCGDWTFLVNEIGRPFTAAGFGNWFRDRWPRPRAPQGRRDYCCEQRSHSPSAHGDLRVGHAQDGRAIHAFGRSAAARSSGNAHA
jgi:hypothetical protein